MPAAPAAIRSAARTAAVVIMIASTVMYLRVLLAVAVVSPEFLQTVILPVAVLMLLTLAAGDGAVVPRAAAAGANARAEKPDATEVGHRVRR